MAECRKYPPSEISTIELLKFIEPLKKKKKTTLINTSKGNLNRDISFLQFHFTIPATPTTMLSQDLFVQWSESKGVFQE